MPTFDIVSKIDMQEVTNAVANSMKEITQRYDFKGSKSNLDLKEKSIVLETEDELKAKQVNEILIGHFVKRNIDPSVLNLKSTEKASGNTSFKPFPFLISSISFSVFFGNISSDKFSKSFSKRLTLLIIC